MSEVSQMRNERPVVTSGFRDLRVLKMTQSIFNNFHPDASKQRRPRVNRRVATDTQKNTVYIREKKHEIKYVVTFALISSNHFMSKYGHVVDAKISVLEYQWKRVQIETASQICTSTASRQDDRVLSAEVTASWWFNTATGFCCDKAWETIKATKMEKLRDQQTDGTEMQPSPLLFMKALA
ncbi:hypothetical protein DPMN_070102 [Dreissena polymorpha]|uniref:Uricase n=1 Tax=Dreissena polymorpha TaxID=45954 RepID=A0A9D4BX50_DREPO|nr:hypothetical protein DPMN_070102 [Dreissena polymorpha]